MARQQAEEQISRLVQSCPDMPSLRRIHALLLKISPPSSSFFALSKILGFCASSPSGDMAYARRIFLQMPSPNIFSWNSMIRGCSNLHPPSTEPISIYRTLLRRGSASPNSFTLSFALKACSLVLALCEGAQIHAQACKFGLDSSPFVLTALLNLYAKCELVGEARSVFEAAQEKNLVTWSVMIGGYARVGMVNEALEMFRKMQEMGIEPDEVTMVSVISACARSGALGLGRWLHALVDRKGISLDMELSTALLDMYAKCGSIAMARKLFDAMPERDTKAWSSMIAGLAVHGLVEDALALFAEMRSVKVKPNEVTFIGVLSACAHRGLVSEGRRFWSTMQELGVHPSMELYGCMVDLLCRAGLVDDANSFVSAMPIPPNSVIFRTLLVGCKNTKMVETGEDVARKLLELEPTNAENYVLLSNLYAQSFQWEKVGRLRKTMKDRGVKAMPGLSCVEVGGRVHEFIAGGGSHPEMEGIRKMMKEIEERIRRAGHRPVTAMVMHDVGEEEKEMALCEHSERLAIAFGMMKMAPPVIIRVVKNLRVCADCHEVTKIISREFEQEIVVRDRVRFHRFKGGVCSCGDFW
ncbi:pentatricopeptide repeat-containing protein At1g59720, chloroplastic/mitochondrial-like [Wolffia australiana]